MTIWVSGLNISGHSPNHTGLAQFVVPATTTDTTENKAATLAQDNTHSKKNNKKKKNKATMANGLDRTQKFFYSAGGVLFACGAGVLLKNALAPTAMPDKPTPTPSHDVPVLIAPPAAFMAAKQQAAFMPSPPQPAAVQTESVDNPLPPQPPAVRSPVRRQPPAVAVAHTKPPVRKALPASSKDRAAPLPPPRPQTAGVRSIGVVIDPEADSRLYQQRQAYAAAPQSSAFTAPPPRPTRGGEGQMTMTVNRAIVRQQQEQAARAAAVAAADQPPSTQPKEKESE